MQLHTLQRETPLKKDKRVGRGGGRGKTSGRGTKGQKARAGHRIMPAIREQLKKLPKRRGYAFKSIQNKPFALNLSVLEHAFATGDVVNPKTIMEHGLVRMSTATPRAIKILGDGELSKKLTITGCAVSSSAKAKIEKAGGKVE